MVFSLLLIKKQKFNDFFNEDEIGSYDSVDDLGKKLKSF